MGFFTNKPNYEQISKELADLHVKVAKQEAIIASLETQIASIRARINGKRLPKTYEEIGEDSQSELNIEAVQRAFGGDMPIELLEKYKKTE